MTGRTPDLSGAQLSPVWSPHAGRRRSARKSHGDRREQALLRSAEQLLQSRPLHEITIEAIAAGAGMSRSQLYFYFDGKAALIDALIERVSLEMLGPFRASDFDMDMGDYVREALPQVFRSWREHRPVFQAAIELAGQDADTRQRWRENIGRFSVEIGSVLERNRASGRLPKIGDSAELAAIAGWMVERNCYMLFTREHDVVEEDRLLAMLIDGLLRLFGAPALGV